MTASPAWHDEWLAASLLAGEMGAHRHSSYSFVCRWCTHPEHGLGCNSTGCGCDSTFTSRDDSWRPTGRRWDESIVRFMDEYGVDGFVAKHFIHMTAVPTRDIPARHRIKRLLTNPELESTP